MSRNERAGAAACMISYGEARQRPAGISQPSRVQGRNERKKESVIERGRMLGLAEGGGGGGRVLAECQCQEWKEGDGAGAGEARR